MAKNKKTKPRLKLKSNTWLPFIPIREMVMFPLIDIPFFIGREKSLVALKQALKGDRMLFVSAQKQADVNDPDEQDIYKVGVVGRIIRSMELADGNVKVIFEGLQRAEVTKFDLSEDNPSVCFKPIKAPTIKDPAYVENISNLIKEHIKEYLGRNDTVHENLKQILEAEKDPVGLCYRLTPILRSPVAKKQAILESNNVQSMLDDLYSFLIMETETTKMEEQIREKINKQINRSQKEYFLNEQMRAIQKMLGKEEQKTEWQELEKNLLKASPPKEVLDVAQKELKKLQQVPPLSSEANIVRNYLDCLIALPWQKKTQDNLDLNNVQKILDADHYGLREIKENILDFIALATRSGELKGPILCFNGPPGVGKTSLAKSIARSLGRKFVRMSLGGIRDEAEIRGHRRTYIGALPGKIISAMKKAKAINPVILLDEVDKISASHMGDPASALLEALDPEQNFAFVDHYLEVEYNLSKVMFICTANNYHAIPHALRDRMELIELSGYSETEKRHILTKHLIPKKIKETGLNPKQISIPTDAMREIIGSYTKESGIRELERTLANLLRKVNRQLLSDKKLATVTINKKLVTKYLGTPKYYWSKSERTPKVGTVNGLAWTVLGGELLIIEALVMGGRGNLLLTGKLGEVMKESAQAALSFVKVNCNLFGIPQEVFIKKDIHLHATESAVPKDGPSAGVALATALVSTLTQIPIRSDVAMTGEITLLGRILPVGGIKEKLLAANRVNIKTVIIPEKNRKELDNLEVDIKKDIKKMEILTFKNLYDLICQALVRVPIPITHDLAETTPQIDPKKSGIETN